MCTGEAAQYVRQQRLAEILLQAQAHPAFKLGPMQRRGRLVVQIQQPAGIAKHRLAGLRQRQSPARLAEDRRACLLLQLFQLGADGRG
jgi:hypothetical protein